MKTQHTWIVIILFLFCGKLYSQVDTEFYFVGPEVTSDHGDSPVVFRITAFDNAATVTITQPAGSYANTITVPANTQVKIELDKDLTENKPADQVNQKGYLITSDEDISVYYEVAHSNNPAKFTLKGKSALGTEFYVPSQTNYENYNYTTNPARERVDIVASEDNTVVTITPTAKIEGHNPNETYTVTLNEGETYSLEAEGRAKGITLAGTYITSDKDIAVTISDDSIYSDDPRNNGSAWDLIGDQLVPVDVLGTAYIAVTTNDLNVTSDRDPVNIVYILAVENTTYATIHGDDGEVTIGPLNAGQQYEYKFNDPAIYIESDKPVYVYQLTGVLKSSSSANELGATVLPKINCTGSKRVSFTKVLTDALFIQVWVKYKNRNGFTLTNSAGTDVTSTYLGSISWKKVPGTGNDGDQDTWYAAYVQLNVSTGEPFYLENTSGYFHLSVLDMNGSSMSYTQFSSYTSMNIQGLTEQCVGNTILLSASEDMASYAWYSDQTGTTVLSTEKSVNVAQTGKYWLDAVSTVDNGCLLSDSIDVVFELPEFELRNDTTVCDSYSETLETPSGFASYLWDDGSTSNTRDVTVSSGSTSEFSITIVDSEGCTASDTVTIASVESPISTVSSTYDMCTGDTLVVSEIDGYTSYQWWKDGEIPSEADTLSTYGVTSQGTYYLELYSELCSSIKQFVVTEHKPSVSLTDVIECPNQTESFTSTGYSGYYWEFVPESDVTNIQSTTNQSIVIDEPGEISLVVTDTYGCKDTAIAKYEWYDSNLFKDILEDVAPVCSNITDYELEANSGYTKYRWYHDDADGVDDEAEITANVVDNIYTIPSFTYNTTGGYYNEAGTYRITAENIAYGCVVEDEIELVVSSTADLDLGADRTVCEGTEVRLQDGDKFDSYEWVDLSNPGVVISTEPYLIASTGSYELTAQHENGCYDTDDITLDVYDTPTATFNSISTQCPGTSFTMEVTNFSTTNGDTNVTYEWYTTDDESTLLSNTDTYTTIDADHDYVVKVSDDEGCYETNTYSPEYYTVEEVEAGDDAEFCDNVNYTLDWSTTSSITSYQWYKDAVGSVNSGTINSSWDVSEAGTYVLEVIDANGCQATDDLELTTLASPVYSLGADRTKCIGDTISVEIEDVDDSFVWNTDATLTDNYIVVNNSQTYSVTVSNDLGCSTTASVDITVADLPTVTLPEDYSVCAGIETTVDAGSGYSSYLWSDGSTTQQVTVDYGTYSVQVTDANGCTGEDEIEIIWYASPEVELGVDTFICPIANIDLDAGAGFSSYLWHTDETTQVIEATNDKLNSVYVTDANGCVGYAAKYVYLLTTPEVDLCSDTAVCTGEELIYDLSDYYTVSWSDGDESLVRQITEAGEYWLVAEDDCYIQTDTVTVEFYELPVITQIDTVIYAQIGVVAEGGTLPYKYSINDSYPTSESVFKNLETGDYIVKVIDFNECADSDTVSLSNILDLEIPSFLTPNGDGINDQFVIEGLDKLPDSIIKIYNRYGKKLAEYKASNQGWDGTYMGKTVKSDDYWYSVQLKPINKLLKGHVTIRY